MKKSLRTVLVSLFAAVFTLPAMADGKDVTGRLWNTDCEEGMSGWNVTFSTTDNISNGFIWRNSNKNETTWYDAGYYNFKGKCIELWGNNTDKGMGEATISQYATGLENGTYVFGVWMVATVQMDEETRNAVGCGDEVAQYVEGVSVFANNNSTPASTNDPKTLSDASHAWKFYAATTVTDGKINVGVKNDRRGTSNFICFDNVSLYYFGDTPEMDALTEMMAIDFNLDKAAADTLKNYPMAKDSIDAIDAATDHESLRLAMKKAQRSIAYYRELSEAIVNAESVLSQEWSEYVSDGLDKLAAAVAEAKNVLATGPYDQLQLKEYLKGFNNYIDYVKVDELYTVKDAFDQFIHAPEEISAENPNMLCGDYAAGFEEVPGEIGYYPIEQKEILEALFLEVENALTAVDEGTLTATEAVAYIQKIKDAVAACIAATNQAPTLPLDAIFIPDPNDETKAYVARRADEADTRSTHMQQYKYNNPRGYVCFRYDSPVFSLPYQIDRLVMSVIHTAYNDRSANSNTDGPYFNISEFYLYDGDGNEIPLTGADFSSNAKEKTEGSYDGLVDRDIYTYFHSSWSAAAKLPEYYHNLSVKMPEGLKEFSIGIEIIWDNNRLLNMPTEVLFSATSNMQSELEAAIEKAVAYDINPGKEPGFYAGDYTTFINALKAAQAVGANSESTDDERYAAINALEEASESIGDAKWNLPEPDVIYQISNQAAFVKNQGKVKNLTVLQDSILWWADADPADEYQNFTFDQVEGPNENEIYFAIRNVKTGKFVGEFTSEPGMEGIYPIEWGNPYYIKLSDTPCAILTRMIGLGQMHFWSYCPADNAWYGLHACNYYNGKETADPGIEGGGKGADHPNGFSINGVCGPVASRQDLLVGSASAWYIRQLETLPISVNAQSDFAQTTHHLYTPVQTLSFTADWVCEFNDFTVKDVFGNPIPCTVTKDGFSAVVTFPQNIETFSFSFDNVEGVKNITITSGVADKPAIAELYDAYKNAVACNFTVGSDIGNAKDLTEFNAVMKVAEGLLENGGTNEQYLQAVKDIQTAMANIEIVDPEEGKQYYIISAYSVFEERYGTEMAVYADENTGQPAWTYLNLESDNYLWEFVPAAIGGFYIRNVATGQYIGKTGSPLHMVAFSAATNPFVIMPYGGGMLNIVDATTRNANDMLHALNHASGGNVFGGLCYYQNEEPSRSVWYIREANNVRTSIDVITEEPEVENKVIGVFDMTGRKVENPSNGLYIINGQKVLVK